MVLLNRWQVLPAARIFNLPVDSNVKHDSQLGANMRIGELADAVGITTKALRFYEEQGLLPPAPRTSGGYRDYTNEAVQRVDFIHRGQAAGLTLAQIRQILEIRDHGEAPCNHVRDLLDARLADVERQLEQLRGLRRTLTRLRDAADHLEPEVCRSEQVCRYL